MLYHKKVCIPLGTLQKLTFNHTKGKLLNAKRPPLAMPKAAFYKPSYKYLKSNGKSACVR